MSWDDTMFRCEDYCIEGGDPEMESSWEYQSFLTDGGIEFAKRILELPFLSGSEIADLEAAINEEEIDEDRIKTIFQLHASEL
jgi:hypothetical protein